MNKLSLIALLFALPLANSFAGDTVRVLIGTQSYSCQFNPELSCAPLNELQKAVMDLKKNGGGVDINDKERNLAGAIRTSVAEGKVNYGMTICSLDSCSAVDTSGGVNGDINQVISGQYKVSETSFNVLAFFITTGTLSEGQLKAKMMKNLKLGMKASL